MDGHLRELRYFVAVAEHLHLTRAAEALFVSQPALSKQVRALLPAVRARFAAAAPGAELSLRQVPWSDAITGGAAGRR